MPEAYKNAPEVVEALRVAGIARLVARLQGLGVPVAVRSAFACSGAHPVCGTVENVIARLPAGSGRRSVLRVAHYDSVAAGGGIADDLASVAALVEVARALKTGPPAANPLILLIDDGEDHDTGACRWVAGSQGDGLPAGLRVAAGFAAEAALPYPWSEVRQYVAPAPATGLPAPELTVVRTVPAGGVDVTLVLRRARL